MKRILVLAVFSSLLVFQMHARILRVNNTPGVTAEYSTLDAAYKAAVDGDTIYLEGSSDPYLGYAKDLTINKSLTIVGPGYWLVENGITGYGTSPAYMENLSSLVITKENVVLKGLVASKIEIQVSNVIVTRCRTAEIRMKEVSNVILHQNYIAGGINGGSNGSSNLSITNNIITGNISSIKSSTISYNHIRCYIIDYIYSSTFKNNMVNMTYTGGYVPDKTCTFDSSNFNGDWDLQCEGGDTEFKVDKHYKLLATSALMTAGSDGKQIGAFGGNDPYVLAGVPNVPLIRSIEVPASANQNDGLAVTVTVTTER